MLDKVQKIHFIGIGGVGMSGLALMMLEQGKEVSGSDLQPGEVTQRLKGLGATIMTGHKAEHVAADVDLVIYTSAVKQDNPELQQARQLGLNVMRRAKLLGALSQEKRTIAVTGAHGKTTTSAMTVAIFDAAKTSSTFVIGGFANTTASDALPTNARTGNGPVMIIEADESDASFIDLHPYQVVVTNVDAEHLDFYADINAIQEAMRAFAKMVPADGTIFVNRDDARSLQTFNSIDNRTLHYFSLHSPAEHNSATQPQAMQTWAEVHDGGRPCRFTIYQGRADGSGAVTKICDVTLALGGLHNISNAVAAAAVALTHQLPPTAIANGLSQYQGVKRRSQLKGETNNIRIYDDYAHHPTEVAALLKTLKTEVSGRLWAVFQPHRYSRFTNHYDDFLRAYGEADAVVVLPVYGANEKQNSCASPSRFALLLKEQQQIHAEYVTGLEEAVDLLQRQLRDGDVIVTTGAGDVYKVGEWLLKRYPVPFSQQEAADVY